MLKLLFHAYGWLDRLKPIPPTRWPHFDLFFLHTGELRMKLNRRWVTLRGPQAVLIYPHTPFEGAAVSPTCRASVQHFGFDRPTGALPLPLAQITRRRAGAELFPRERSGVAEADVHRAIAMAATRQTPYVRDVRAALLCLVLGQLRGRMDMALPPHAAAGGPPGSLPVQVEGLLRRDLARPASVQEIAAAVGMSFGTFRATFRRQSGVSPARFVRDLRMREAQRLLRETDLPTKQIGRMVGYPELPHLYRTFRAHGGSTPAQYRAAFKRFG